jgi:hypothetical protein
MLYALLSGCLPFGEQETPSALLEKAIVHEAPQRDASYYQNDPNLQHCSDEV